MGFSSYLSTASFLSAEVDFLKQIRHRNFTTGQNTFLEQMDSHMLTPANGLTYVNHFTVGLFFGKTPQRWNHFKEKKFRGIKLVLLYIYINIKITHK